jgi:hypothetical protein
MNREYTRFPVQFLRNSTGILEETVFEHITVGAFFSLLLFCMFSRPNISHGDP